MGIVNCAVVGCTRNSRQIDKWKKISCEKHTGQLHNICVFVNHHLDCTVLQGRNDIKTNGLDGLSSLKERTLTNLNGYPAKVTECAAIILLIKYPLLPILTQV